MNTAPVIVFAYNRPDHLRKTLTWLGQNELANESTLYIFCDGPKHNATTEQLAKVENVREVAHEVAVVPMFKEVHVIEREENLGLGTSVISGVTEIINKYGKVIVLEDDLETSPYFLSYMNQCLDHYDARKSVFSITGLSRPHPERFFPQDYPYDVYCAPVHRPWGWATWADRWNQVDWGANAYKILKANPQIRKAFERGGIDNWDELYRQQELGLNLWSVRFGLAHFVNHAVSIAPIVSYVHNDGWGDDSTNCKGDGSNWKYDELNNKGKNFAFCDILYEDARIINAWYSFSNSKPRSKWGKLKNWYGRKFLHRDEYALKGRVFAEQ